MSKHFVTTAHLQRMFLEQEKLNKKYNGENWRDGIQMGYMKTAYWDEVGEFARELTPDWKWWSGKAKAKTIDFDKALYELIDVIHFGLMLILFRHDITQVVFRLGLKPTIEADMYGVVDDKYDHFIKANTRFLYSVAQHNLEQEIRNLLNVIETGCNVLGVQYADTVYYAYMEKNSLNHKRVEGGQLEGTYDKSTEVYNPLIDHPRSPYRPEGSGKVDCMYCNYGKNPCNEFCYGEDL